MTGFQVPFPLLASHVGGFLRLGMPAIGAETATIRRRCVLRVRGSDLQLPGLWRRRHSLRPPCVSTGPRRRSGRGLAGYRVYRDGQSVAETGPEARSFDDQRAGAGEELSLPGRGARPDRLHGLGRAGGRNLPSRRPCPCSRDRGSAVRRGGRAAGAGVAGAVGGRRAGGRRQLGGRGCGGGGGAAGVAGSAAGGDHPAGRDDQQRPVRH